MINRPVRDIVASDLEALIRERRQEDKTIEYKADLPSDKFEILKDVSALANTEGGDIIFGIAEGAGQERGIPSEVVGLVGSSDEAMRRLLDIVRTGLQPPLLLQEMNLKKVEFADGKVALVVRVPQSFSGPHQIRERYVFWGRNAGGNYQLDTGELRRAFKLQDGIAERIRLFRADRLLQIKGNNGMPVALEDGPRLVLHIVPFSAFSLDTTLDIGAEANSLTGFKPLSNQRSWRPPDFRINVDGCLLYEGLPQSARAYTQVYRSGVVEAVKALRLDTLKWPDEEFASLNTNQFSRPYDSRTYLGYETQVLYFVRHYAQLLNTLGIEPPMYVFLAMLGVSGYHLYAEVPQPGAGGEPDNWSRLVSEMSIDRADLILPEVTSEVADDNFAAVLKPSFDILWNAVGRPSCPNYVNQIWRGPSWPE